MVASLKPSPGWSSLTPMTTRPRCVIVANVVEPSTLTPAAAFCVTPEPSEPGLPSFPQAERARAPTSSPAARWRSFMMEISCPGR